MLAEHRVRSLAYQLTDALEAYGESFRHWCQSPSDIAKYQRADAQLQLVQLLVEQTFSTGRGEMSELSLYHLDIKILVLRRHLAVQAGDPTRPGDDAQLEKLRGKHEAAIQALLQLCRQRSRVAVPQELVVAAKADAVGQQRPLPHR
ncbi:hypothetical protein [Ramlibacter tataouinensis]|uniref:hypothetical protein n=1 Tax=Ramlibacter tataouinensis TaxID=94132 RepID=UPI0005A1310D|nr:hypothetical protein [Ramlibacter tataouinensis]